MTRTPDSDPNENDVPHWGGVSFSGLDTRHWLPYLPPEVVEQAANDSD
ncbi:MAG TPA: hypothetical protein VHA73_10095 [Acidimicrobiales bacterium]|jgi:hypothetical protein|nr:hypothetical protein [Acidimicrobiales bacterium]